MKNKTMCDPHVLSERILSPLRGEAAGFPPVERAL